MFDDLAAYYHENVVSSFVDYRDIAKNGTAGSSRDVRNALIAAEALFHMREHLPGATLSRAVVEGLCPDYALLGDIVNASKHKILNSKTPHGEPLINNAANLGEEIDIIEYEDDEGIYKYIQKNVVVKLSDGSERNLLKVLTNVLNYWEQHMLTLGVISSARTFEFDADARLRTRDECTDSKLDFNVVQGQRFHQRMRLLRFNKSTGMAEPIDLTGCEVRMNIRKPNFNVQLSLTHEASGKVISTQIPLTEDENNLLSQIESNFERQAFLNGLPAAQTAFQKLAFDAGLTK